MKKKRLTSDETIRETLGDNPVFYTIGVWPQKVYKYEDNNRTDEVVAVRLPVTIYGVAYDTVKLPKDALTSFSEQDFAFKQVEFVSLKAVEFNGNVYFSADSVAIKKEKRDVQ